MFAAPKKIRFAIKASFRKIHKRREIRVSCKKANFTPSVNFAKIDSGSKSRRFNGYYSVLSGTSANFMRS
jgi:hypothetical protein